MSIARLPFARPAPLVTALLLSVALSGSAQAHKPVHYEAEIRGLMATIEDGRKAGTITFFEGRKLRRQVRDAYVLVERSFEDNRLSRSEHKLLRDAFDAVEDKIDREAKDGWRRARFLPRVGR